MGELMVSGLFVLLVFLGGCMCGSSLTAGRLKGGGKFENKSSGMVSDE
ncbi:MULTISPECIES: hypothetical protein [unclassified Bacillus (in: firmicutes)]|nr:MULTISPECIES: hypothetical protein [unclassified Bacillus (in: firmicutes)]MBT2615097.1 hypothetical protein [Bacillus sp. ISL-78]MBT2627714.1 hypothetical protein [Bacillus sp. ISL-101]